MPPAGLRLLPRGPLPALGQFNTVDGDLHRAWARLLPAAGTLCVLHQDDLGSKRRNWADGEATGAAVASFLFPRPILVHTRTWIIRIGDGKRKVSNGTTALRRRGKRHRALHGGLRGGGAARPARVHAGAPRYRSI